MEKSFYNIYKTFFKVGTLLLGGGYVILPLLQAELVDKKQWITEDELCEFYALGQSVPGVIAPNTAVFVGYRLNKIKGSLAAIIGMIMPAFISIIIIAKMMEEIIQLKFIQSIFWGVGIGVLILIFLAVKEMWKKSIVDKFSCAVFFSAFLLSAAFKAPPASIIILAIFVGIWVQYQKRLEKRDDKEF